MNYKKKSLIISILLIVSIQILLLINNKQKTTLRYFIWNVQNISIGRLICISFISGLLVSSTINKTLNDNLNTFSENKENEKFTNENDYSINREDNNESFEMPPERDLRDNQPTISVNYRVIKNNVQNESDDRDQQSNKTQYQDDWDNNNSDW